MTVSHEDWELHNSKIWLINKDTADCKTDLSNLDRHLDRLHFVVKKLQIKQQKYWLFTGTFFLIMSREKGRQNKTNKQQQRKQANLSDLSSAHGRSRAKCQLVQTSYILHCLPYNKHLINRPILTSVV